MSESDASCSVCRYTIALLQAKKRHLFFLKTISVRRRSQKRHVKSDPMGIICDDGLIVFARPVDAQSKRISFRATTNCKQ